MKIKWPIALATVFLMQLGGFLLYTGGIARTLDELLTKGELRKRLGENGRNAVMKTYNWETDARRLTALYEDIASQLRPDPNPSVTNPSEPRSRDKPGRGIV